MFTTVLIANRGAIACRIIRTLHKLGIHAIAVYTKADADSLHVRMADAAELIGDGPATSSYLDIDKILAATVKHGAQAIHPGYGFLSENTHFAARCAEHGIAFVGPRPEHITAFGLKHTARQLAEQNQLPLAPGSGLLDNELDAVHTAAQIGYPVMLKSTAGGGGIGMQICRDDAELTSAFASVQRLSKNNFGNAGVFIEKYIERARHIEVQVFGDGKGKVVAIGERDCSLQRRNQKVIEETPAPNLKDSVRQALHHTAVRLCESVNYANAGTVEFIYDASSEAFYFLEVNTRLQVEHGVTEMVTGIDLVEMMLQEACGELPDLASLRIAVQGHAVQARLYAEDPWRNFQPQSGLLTAVSFPDNTHNQQLRIDHWIENGVTVSPFYDPMLAKVIAHAETRETALQKLSHALQHTVVAGIETNRRYLLQLLQDEVFVNAQMTTRYLNDRVYPSAAIEVMEGGTNTTVQDVPGRLGYWHVGVPPSGPFDDYSFRLGNRLLDNAKSAAGLEITLNGPTLKFRSDCDIVLTGAAMPATIDGVAVGFWQIIPVSAGSVLRIGAASHHGARAYLCVRNGLDIPPYLGSASTFTLGQFGGHGGRSLRIGDVLHLHMASHEEKPSIPRTQQAEIAPTLRPTMSNHWDIHVLYGPHGAPDFFTEQDIDTLFATAWEVHYNSSRTGVRLIGPKPQWARQDGGEAGLHPSNIHDNAYAIGAIDFTGDMPVILGPDGPSLGGFVCPAVVMTADHWKLGQLRPGDKITFIPVSPDDAQQLEQRQLTMLRTLIVPDAIDEHSQRAPAIINQLSTAQHPTGVVYRIAGDKYILVEYGPLILDINLRFRVHALWQWLMREKITGIIDITPGIRSLQVHYDSNLLSRKKLLDCLQRAEQELSALEDSVVPARDIWLPLSWDDPSTRLAIDKYMQSVSKDAPWCPSNIEFIRRINGLASIAEVKRIVFDAQYLVMGLGDVYLGAPVATPLDPRHRLVTTKYNPARTWTPENAVGIGGSYLCVYGMEGPGGYQFVGRTLQMWNRWRKTAEFNDPWLLRFFDRIHFFPVSAEELIHIREEFPRGNYRLRIEESSFSLRDYNHFLSDNRASIASFKQLQQQAFEAEREHWKISGYNANAPATEATVGDDNDITLAENEILISSHVPGSIWQIAVQVGDVVNADTPVMIVESMKMEIAVTSSQPVKIVRVLVNAGTQVQPGTALAIAEIVSGAA
jgi:urea carboxylase